jgi:hypothetical protein
MESNPRASNMRGAGKLENWKKGKPGRIFSLSLAGEEQLQLRFPASFLFKETSFERSINFYYC